MNNEYLINELKNIENENKAFGDVLKETQKQWLIDLQNGFGENMKKDLEKEKKSSFSFNIKKFFLRVLNTF